MTPQQAKEALVAWANEQVGYAEGPNNQNQYAPLWTEAGGWNAQNQPWCDVFVDVGFIETFGSAAAARMTYQPRGGFSALCSASADFYRQHGAFVHVPEVGDQIFFYVGGAINHTGIVVSVGMGAITTVEGNSSDMVARRTYAIDSPAIAGYGRPDWSAVADQDAAAAPSAPSAPTAPAVSYDPYVCAVKVNLLKIGAYGPQVANMQHLLQDHGFDVGEIDGRFGPQTQEALRSFQTAAGIGVDGEWGGESFNAMWNYN